MRRVCAIFLILFLISGCERTELTHPVIYSNDRLLLKNLPNSIGVIYGGKKIILNKDKNGFFNTDEFEEIFFVKRKLIGGHGVPNDLIIAQGRSVKNGNYFFQIFTNDTQPITRSDSYFTDGNIDLYLEPLVIGFQDEFDSKNPNPKLEDIFLRDQWNQIKKDENGLPEAIFAKLSFNEDRSYNIMDIFTSFGLLLKKHYGGTHQFEDFSFHSRVVEYTTYEKINYVAPLAPMLMIFDLTDQNEINLFDNFDTNFSDSDLLYHALKSYLLDNCNSSFIRSKAFSSGGNAILSSLFITDVEISGEWCSIITPTHILNINISRVNGVNCSVDKSCEFIFNWGYDFRMNPTAGFTNTPNFDPICPVLRSAPVRGIAKYTALSEREWTVSDLSWN